MAKDFNSELFSSPILNGFYAGFVLGFFLLGYFVANYREYDSFFVLLAVAFSLPVLGLICGFLYKKLRSK